MLSTPAFSETTPDGVGVHGSFCLRSYTQPINSPPTLYFNERKSFLIPIEHRHTATRCFNGPDEEIFIWDWSDVNGREASQNHAGFI